jgi:hypothetical protein
VIDRCFRALIRHKVWESGGGRCWRVVGHGWCRWSSVHVKQGERTGKSKVNGDSVSLRRHGDCNDGQWTRALIGSGRKDESKDLERVV